MLLDHDAELLLSNTVPVSCQIYTPADLAFAMVTALGDYPGARWLEPGHGRGAFLEALAKYGVGKERITAIDLDPNQAAADRLGTVVRGVDFLSWSAASQSKFDRIIGNPPYIAINRLPAALKAQAGVIANLNGNSIGPGGNLWHAFVLRSLSILNDGGSLAFVLPSAASYANYALDVRQYMTESFEKVELFQSKRPLFDDVQDGTIVVIARNHLHGPAGIKRRSVTSRNAVVKSLLGLRASRGRKCRTRSASPSDRMIRLGDIATIRLGGVTGDASYFLMNDEKRMRLGLPVTSLRKVVSKARHLRSSRLTESTWRKLLANGERVWLFSPPDSAVTHPNVDAYLQLDVAWGGCKRTGYKVSIRDPWYRTALPKAAHAFISGMSQFGPWMCINEADRVNATNTLYVVSFARPYYKDKYKWALALLTSSAQRQVRQIGRRYPDGLVKYEPRQILDIQLPRMRGRTVCQCLYNTAVKELFRGGPKLACDIADSALRRA